jgi:hypothetical protein
LDKGTFNKLRLSTLTTLVGEAETALKGKQAKKFNMVTLVQKFHSNVKVTLNLKYSEELHTELCILAEYIPEQLTEEELDDIIKSQDKEMTLGKTMQFLNTNYKGRFKGELAKKLYLDLKY